MKKLDILDFSNKSGSNDRSKGCKSSKRQPTVTQLPTAGSSETGTGTGMETGLESPPDKTGRWHFCHLIGFNQ
jgi:hypothetical protein